MTGQAILARKGTDVVTTDPATSLAEAVKILAAKRIGAVVVTDPNAASPASYTSATSCVRLLRRALQHSLCQSPR